MAAPRRPAVHASSPGKPVPPFLPGDVVTLKSGGFDMTVVRMIDTCAEKNAFVEVMYCRERAWSEIKTEHLPVIVLKPSTGAKDLTDPIPF